MSLILSEYEMCPQPRAIPESRKWYLLCLMTLVNITDDSRNAEERITLAQQNTPLLNPSGIPNRDCLCPRTTCTNPPLQEISGTAIICNDWPRRARWQQRRREGTGRERCATNFL